jgi:hypothetical protein
MPNGTKLFIPAGVIKTGTLAAIIRQSGLSRDQFSALL